MTRKLILAAIAALVVCIGLYAVTWQPSAPAVRAPVQAAEVLGLRSGPAGSAMTQREFLRRAISEECAADPGCRAYFDRLIEAAPE